MPVHEIHHPLISHKLALMRKAHVSTKQFRELSNEVASLLTYEASRGLVLEEVSIDGWQGQPIPVRMLAGKKLTIVPILRAGLGMLEGVMQLVPNAKVSVVGLYRDEETLEPVAYFDKIITSEKLGVKKPNPEIFQHAIEMAKTNKEESVYIGDNLVVDILGCQNFGMDGVFFNPEKENHTEKPKFEISCLSELKTIF